MYSESCCSMDAQTLRPHRRHPLDPFGSAISVPLAVPDVWPHRYGINSSTIVTSPPLTMGNCGPSTRASHH